MFEGVVLVIRHLELFFNHICEARCLKYHTVCACILADTQHKMATVSEVKSAAVLEGHVA